MSLSRSEVQGIVMFITILIHQFLTWFFICVQAKLVQTLDHGTTRPVHSLSFHHAEACLLTACADKVFVWRAAQDDDSWYLYF